MEIITKNYTLFLTIALAMLSGLSIRILLSLVKQRWVSTYHHTMSYILLPVITLIITKVISGNIALSIGMIGALSIVRFRNPVKNPFELVIFFALITIGISMSVNMSMGLLLAIIVDVTIVASYVIEIISRRLNIHVFSLSFDEGSSNNTMEVHSSQAIDVLHDSKFLIQYVNDKKSSEHHYRLASKNKIDIENIRKNIQEVNNILQIEVSML